jgi:radical SAM protein with 4Fe4S-binding SPASM domain
MHKPFSLFNIELTNNCVMKCVMCPRTNNMTRQRGYMDVGLYKKAIDELVECNPGFRNSEILWLHHFGESLLHPEFGRCIAYASRLNIRIGLSINPIMLKDPIIDELLAAEPYILYVSLDGHDDATFQKIRGIDNIYEISKLRLMAFLREKVQNRSNILAVLSMIDFNLNHPSIEITRAYWESIPGIDHFLAKSFTAWDGGAADVNTFLAGGNPSYDRASVRCTMPWERMTVTWDGTVVPCCFDYDMKYVLGDMRHETLSDIWNGKRMNRLRKEFTANKVTNPLCRNCERLYLPRDLWKL